MLLIAQHTCSWCLSINFSPEPHTHQSSPTPKVTLLHGCRASLLISLRGVRNLPYIGKTQLLIWHQETTHYSLGNSPKLFMFRTIKLLTMCFRQFCTACSTYLCDACKAPSSSSFLFLEDSTSSCTCVSSDCTCVSSDCTLRSCREQNDNNIYNQTESWICTLSLLTLLTFTALFSSSAVSSDFIFSLLVSSSEALSL